MKVNQIICGDALSELKKLPDNSVDSIISDPPAGIAFMNKKWDDMGDLMGFQNFICEVFTEAIRVLKPGGHALVWAIPRTSHHTGMGLEMAGFEIRDTILHLFGSGFPKSHNVANAIDKLEGNKREKIGELKLTGTARNKETRGAKTSSALDHEYTKDRTKTDITKGNSPYEGFGTALKPATEIWWLCRKPLSEKSIASNVLKWSTGGLNIDGCRIGIDGKDYRHAGKRTKTFAKNGDAISGGEGSPDYTPNPTGRFPANLILSCICEIDEQAQLNYKCHGNIYSCAVQDNLTEHSSLTHTNPNCPCYMLDEQCSGASRFFYQAKPSKRERNLGCEELDLKQTSGGGGGIGDYIDDVNSASGKYGSEKAPANNFHPTVKSISLMRYLCRLITPPKGTVLDPFAGSGSTLIAAKLEGFNFIGIEKEKDYIKIARARIKAWGNQQTLL